MKVAWFSSGFFILIWTIPVCLALIILGILMITNRKNVAEKLRNLAIKLGLLGFVDFIDEIYVVGFGITLVVAAAWGLYVVIS